MTVVRMMMAALCALAAGVAVENAKAKVFCGGADAIDGSRQIAQCETRR